MIKNNLTEQKFTDISASFALNHNTATAPDKPIIMSKRIGSTTYQVAVHFSQTSNETMGDKVSRLIQREALDK